VQPEGLRIGSEGTDPNKTRRVLLPRLLTPKNPILGPKIEVFGVPKPGFGGSKTPVLDLPEKPGFRVFVEISTKKHEKTRKKCKKGQKSALFGTFIEKSAIPSRLVEKRQFPECRTG